MKVWTAIGRTPPDQFSYTTDASTGEYMGLLRLCKDNDVTEAESLEPHSWNGGMMRHTTVPRVEAGDGMCEQA